jgi:hypothetical protein
MIVEINRETMVFVRRMDNQSTLSKLAHIEHPHFSVYITPEDGNYELLTDFELKKLIANSGGPDVKHVFSRSALVRVLHQLTQALPVFEANAFEVDMQMRTIPEDDDRPYVYVRGAMKPTLAEEGLDTVALQYAGNALNVPASTPQPRPQGTVAGSAPQAATRAPSAPSADDFVQPRPGTSTHDIFAFCAKLWDDTGRTADEKQLADIRKQAVDQLVPKGLNVSTVRTQAMRWYHNRQRFAG